jgi:hypothetical protein
MSLRSALDLHLCDWLAACTHAAAGLIAATQDQLAAARYFFHHELTKIGPWLAVVETREATCRDLPDAWF